MPNEPWKPGKQKPVDKKLLAEARKFLKEHPPSIPNMSYTGVVPNNGLRCTCSGMVPDPECVLHHVIGPYSSKPTIPK